MLIFMKSCPPPHLRWTEYAYLLANPSEFRTSHVGDSRLLDRLFHACAVGLGHLLVPGTPVPAEGHLWAPTTSPTALRHASNWVQLAEVRICVGIGKAWYGRLALSSLSTSLNGLGLGRVGSLGAMRRFERRARSVDGWVAK